MFSTILLTLVSTALLAGASTTPASTSLQKRTGSQGVLIGCYAGGAGCPCPIDNNGDTGVLINVFPGYQCAYPNGACSWSDRVCFYAPIISLKPTSLTTWLAEWRASEYRSGQLPFFCTLPQHRLYLPT